jgi:hypothetical protein
MEEGENVGRMGKGKNDLKKRGKKKGKDEKEIPYYLGGFDINFIIFINV